MSFYPHSTKELCPFCAGVGVYPWGERCVACDGKGVLWFTHGVMKGLNCMITRRLQRPKTQLETIREQIKMAQPPEQPARPDADTDL